MSDWQIAGVAWLVLSVIVAPMVGRFIAYRARFECPECLEAAQARHPSRDAHRGHHL